MQLTFTLPQTAASFVSLSAAGGWLQGVACVHCVVEGGLVQDL